MPNPALMQKNAEAFNAFHHACGDGHAIHRAALKGETDDIIKQFKTYDKSGKEIEGL